MYFTVSIHNLTYEYTNVVIDRLMCVVWVSGGEIGM
jgi:hypothetical protein